MKVKFRVFGSKNCKDCNNLMSNLEKNGTQFYMIDAYDPKNEFLCDSNEVNVLPHMQIINKKSNQVLFEHTGAMSEDYLKDLILKFK